MREEPGQPRVLFRCDAGRNLGGGHLMRCLALADSLAAGGAWVTFACSRESFETVAALGASGYPAIVLDDPSDTAALAAKKGRWDAAVIDHYGLDARHETALRRAAPVILVIDDLADRRHDCDILVDQTVGRTRTDYAALVPAAAELCLGPEFSLLRPEFAHARPAALAARLDGRPVKRIFVSLGMTDIGGITAHAVRAALAAGLDAEIAVAVGSRAESLPELRALAADSRVRLHLDCPNVCALMADSDIAIGAAGTTSWERCCLGLPTLVLVVAENQAAIARNLAQLGAAELVPPLDPAILTAGLARLAANPVARVAMARAAGAVCDGEGTRRTAEELLSAIGSA